MPDAPPKRPRGRPRLKDGEQSVTLHFRMPASEHRTASLLAERNSITVPELMRAALRVATRRQGTFRE